MRAGEGAGSLLEGVLAKALLKGDESSACESGVLGFSSHDLPPTPLFFFLIKSTVLFVDSAVFSLAPPSMTVSQR